VAVGVDADVSAAVDDTGTTTRSRTGGGVG
jgi:hypothetical protein